MRHHTRPTLCQAVPVITGPRLMGAQINESDQGWTPLKYSEYSKA